MMSKSRRRELLAELRELNDARLEQLVAEQRARAKVSPKLTPGSAWPGLGQVAQAIADGNVRPVSYGFPDRRAHQVRARELLQRADEHMARVGVEVQRGPNVTHKPSWANVEPAARTLIAAAQAHALLALSMPERDPLS